MVTLQIHRRAGLCGWRSAGERWSRGDAGFKQGRKAPVHCTLSEVACPTEGGRGSEKCRSLLRSAGWQCVGKQQVVSYDGPVPVCLLMQGILGKRCVLAGDISVPLELEGVTMGLVVRFIVETTYITIPAHAQGSSIGPFECIDSDRREDRWARGNSVVVEPIWSRKADRQTWKRKQIFRLTYWASQKNLVKGCRQTLDCYCVSCELLSTSMADALLYVNICVSGIFHGHFAQRLAVNKPCLQIWHLMIYKHGLFTANRCANRPWNMPDTRMYTNSKASAMEADNNSQLTQLQSNVWRQPLTKFFWGAQ